jgi:hypothetical protein
MLHLLHCLHLCKHGGHAAADFLPQLIDLTRDDHQVTTDILQLPALRSVLNSSVSGMWKMLMNTATQNKGTVLHAQW